MHRPAMRPQLSLTTPLLTLSTVLSYYAASHSRLSHTHTHTTLPSLECISSLERTSKCEHFGIILLPGALQCCMFVLRRESSAASCEPRNYLREGNTLLERDHASRREIFQEGLNCFESKSISSILVHNPVSPPKQNEIGKNTQNTAIGSPARCHTIY